MGQVESRRIAFGERIGGADDGAPICERRKDRLYRLAEHIHSIRTARDFPHARNNRAIPAGYTYLGQLIAHDLTFHDIRPTRFDVREASEEFPRTTTLDLDSIYGGGPEVSPWLYEPEADANAPRYRLLLGQSRHKDDCDRTTGLLDDVPRVRCPMSADNPGRPRHDPLVADPRNDQHLVISQLLVLFCKFHNIVADALCAAHESGMGIRGRGFSTEIFPQAKAVVSGVFGEIVAGDYLKKLLSPEVYSRYLEIYRERRFDHFRLIAISLDDRRFAVPDEFWLAAFRLGHAMVQNRYNVSTSHNLDRDSLRELGIANLLKLAGPASYETPVTREWVVEWDRFFFEPDEVEGLRRRDNRRLVNFSHLLEPTAAAGLGVATGRFKTEDGRRTLLYRDFARGLQNGLPSAQEYLRTRVLSPDAGQAVASPEAILDREAIRAWLRPERNVLSPLTEDDIESIVAETPLLFYLLCECAAAPGHGRHLGPLGSTIVAEVVFGALLATPDSAFADTWRFLFGDEAPTTMTALFRFVERHWTARSSPGVCGCTAGHG